MRGIIFTVVATAGILLLAGCPTPNDPRQTTYAVKVSPSGAESGESVSAGVSEAAEGVTVTLTAALNGGRRVDVSASGVTITPSTISSDGGTATFTMPAADVEVTATFDVLEPLLKTGFETTLLEEGWKRENLEGTGDKWARRTNIKRTGSASAGMENQFSGSQEDDWLITPGITVTANSELRFYRCSAWFDLYHYNGVWVSTVDQNPANFNELVELGEAPDGGWHLFSVDLSAYAGQTIYVAFVYEYTNSVGDSFYIDDVEVTQ